MLGTPLWQLHFVAKHLRTVRGEQPLLFLSRIPVVAGTLSAGLLSLHCATTRATYQLRSVRLEAVAECARGHDRDLWQFLENILRNDLDQCDPSTRDSPTLPLSLGGLGLRSAVRTRSAHWSIWADCLPMIIHQHPAVAEHLIHEPEGRPITFGGSFLSS